MKIVKKLIQKTNKMNWARPNAKKMKRGEIIMKKRKKEAREGS